MRGLAAHTEGFQIYLLVSFGSEGPSPQLWIQSLWLETGPLGPFRAHFVVNLVLRYDRPCEESPPFGSFPSPPCGIQPWRLEYK